MYLIHAFSFFIHSGFVSGSMSMFTSTNQIYSSCNIRREFDFSDAIFTGLPLRGAAWHHTLRYLHFWSINAGWKKHLARSFFYELPTNFHISNPNCQIFQNKIL